MDEALIQFLSQFEAFSDDDIKSIVNELPVKAFQKGECIVKEGDLNEYCYFILSGSARQFKLLEGEEKTTAFYTEYEAIIIANITSSNHSKEFVEANESTLVIKGRSDNSENMFEKYPKLQSVVMTLMEKFLSQAKFDFNSFIGSSPEEKYKQFMDSRGELFNRFPQHQIASYLGMKPETLSRIKKRVLMK